MNDKKDITVKILEKVARTSVKAAADSRCVCLFHQPMMPTDLKKFSK